MLKLKYLFNNKDLACMVINNWEYYKEAPDLFEYFRISANAVYWYKNQGKNNFLRFVPAEEKSKESVLAELDFLRFLRTKGFSAAHTVLSKDRNEIEEVKTPWGIYYAAAFSEVPGKPLDRIELTEDIIFGWGKALGELHRTSCEYEPEQYKRKSWKEIMDWMEEVLLNFPEEVEAKKELVVLEDFFSKLPATKENFGLIHYDFEADNVFYDEASKIYSAIDFDDAMYHWFAMDIEQAIDSMKGELEEEQIQSAVNQFIKGYNSAYSVSEEMLAILPVFRRYADLYGYVRILRSVDEKWNNEPEWMVNLREHLNKLMVKRKSSFGRVI